MIMIMSTMTTNTGGTMRGGVGMSMRCTFIASPPGKEQSDVKSFSEVNWVK